MDRDTSALLQQADALRRAGRVEEAIAAYRQLLAREPDLPNSWYNLGWLSRQARQFGEALDCYAEALKRSVRDPEEVHLNRAVILSEDLRRPQEAIAELKAALDCRPDYVPALLNLGNVHEDLGDRAAAERAYAQALEIAPDDSLALSRLAGVMDAKSEAGAGIAKRIEDALKSRANAADRADLGFALARLLDGRGDYDRAFKAADAANRASRESFGPGYRRYENAAQEGFIERLIGAFNEPSDAVEDDAATPPVFIVGMFRSGSTLVEQILAGHSRVRSGGELDLIPALVARIAGYPEAAAEAGNDQLSAWRAFYREGLEPLAGGDAMVTDKRPDNFLHIGLIKRLFPGAKIIHTRRDRLDTLVSLHFLHLGPDMPYALDIADSAHWYDQHERLMDHWKSLYPKDIFELDYDVLVQEPKAQIERLSGFLGLSWDDGMLEFHRRGGPVRTASVWQVREPIHARSSGRWRNYASRLKRALDRNGKDG